mmetsp:Transcript_40686/g.62071  ORF Transcript_40686/g.62071 Transcript_40686/m.62071 type:complete len:130 (+) Transcript_40686:1194-1583(+)
MEGKTNVLRSGEDLGAMQFGTVGQVTSHGRGFGEGSLDDLDTHDCSTNYPIPADLENKGEYLESVPLFLNDNYKKIYQESKEAAMRAAAVKSMTPTSGTNASRLGDADQNKRKGAAKLYKSQWIQEKLV